MYGGELGFGVFFLYRGVLIDDLSQQCLMCPIDIIHIVKNVGNMKRHSRQFLVELCLIEFFVTSEGYFLFHLDCMILSVM